MSKTNTVTANAGGGIGILTVVQIVFLILKIAGLVDWKWSIVLLPLWIDLGLFAVILLVLLIIFIITYVTN